MNKKTLSGILSMCGGIVSYKVILKLLDALGITNGIVGTVGSIVIGFTLGSKIGYICSDELDEFFDCVTECVNKYYKGGNF